MQESIKQRTKINDEWFYEIYNYQEEELITINLVNLRTGEIRQKIVSYDTIARRVFQSEIKTWKRQYNEIITKSKNDIF